MSSVVSRDWRITARSLLQWLPGILISFWAFWFIARVVDWPEFLALLGSIPPGTLLFNVALYFITITVRSLCWQFLLQRKVTLGQSFLALSEGYMLNNILPFRLGELGRAFLLGRRSRLGMFRVLSTVVVERSYDLAFAAGLLLATLPLALGMEWARPAATILLFVILSGLLLLYLAARNRDWVERMFEQIAGRWTIVKRFILPQIHSVLDGFSVLTRFDFFAASLGLLALTWLLGIFRDWILIRAFVPNAPMWWGALGVSATNIAGAVPSVMASLGTFEAGATGALSLVGMPVEAALAYALVVHVTHLIFSSLIGFYGLSREGQTISNLVLELRSLRQSNLDDRK